MKLFILLMLFSTLGCGLNGIQKLETNDSEYRVIQEGESFTYVVLRLEFIDQIRQICLDANPISDFDSEADRNKATATCTLDNLSLFSISVDPVSDFITNYCEEGADLSGLTEEQLLQITEGCATLGV